MTHLLSICLSHAFISKMSFNSVVTIRNQKLILKPTSLLSDKIASLISRKPKHPFND